MSHQYLMSPIIPCCSSESQKIIVELGMGNGCLLKRLLEANKNTSQSAINEKKLMYIGIEVNSLEYNKAKSLLHGFTNVILINGSFEQLINDFTDHSIDEIISVLPDPDFIDIENQDQWKKFYRMMNRKMSTRGRFRLVTELIDDLLGPVSAEVYKIWKQWVINTFEDIGFSLERIIEGSPTEYESDCLGRFKGDPERIRLATFDFIKIG
jgi:ubiquinone/menaquinone biosynthesis C-methylase UbiE